MSTFLSRIFVTLCFSGLALFIGGAWLKNEVVMNIGAGVLVACGATLALFVPLLIVEAARALTNSRRQS